MYVLRWLSGVHRGLTLQKCVQVNIRSRHIFIFDLLITFVRRVAEALILGTMMVGQATAFAPNYNKAVVAAARVFKLLDRAPLIDGDGQSGVRLVSCILEKRRMLCCNYFFSFP